MPVSTIKRWEVSEQRRLDMPAGTIRCPLLGQTSLSFRLTTPADLQAQYLCLYFVGLPGTLDWGVETYPLRNLYRCCCGILSDTLCHEHYGPPWCAPL